jgi:hypothetical protein
MILKLLEQLQKHIIMLGLTDVYYGTSTWLNPHKVSGKNSSGSYVVADNLCFSNDLTFDIDCDN